MSDRIAEQEKRIARHAEREAELKVCKKIIKEIKERKEKLVEEARNKIDSAEARQLILARWERTLYATVEEYLAQYSRTLRSSLENLWEKYHQPLHSILKERDAASVELAGYLKKFGYELNNSQAWAIKTPEIVTDSRSGTDFSESHHTRNE